MTLEDDSPQDRIHSPKQRLVIQPIDEQSLREVISESPSLTAQDRIPAIPSQPDVTVTAVPPNLPVIEPVIIELKYPLITPLQARIYAALALGAGGLVLAEKISSAISRSQQVHEPTSFSLFTVMFDIFPWVGSVVAIIGALGLFGLSLQGYRLLKFVHVCTSVILLLYLPFTIFFLALSFNALFTNPLGALMIISMNAAWIGGFFFLYRRDTRLLSS